jgi:hypothetical protein
MFDKIDRHLLCINKFKTDTKIDNTELVNILKYVQCGYGRRNVKCRNTYKETVSTNQHWRCISNNDWDFEANFPPEYGGCAKYRKNNNYVF